MGGSTDRGILRRQWKFHDLCLPLLLRRVNLRTTEPWTNQQPLH